MKEERLVSSVSQRHSAGDWQLMIRKKIQTGPEKTGQSQCIKFIYRQTNSEN